VAGRRFRRPRRTGIDVDFSGIAAAGGLRNILDTLIDLAFFHTLAASKNRTRELKAES
jgi:hypothetical protein